MTSVALCLLIICFPCKVLAVCLLGVMCTYTIGLGRARGS